MADRREAEEAGMAKPLSRLAVDLNVSDSAIRKRCKQRGIELPKNGHWQREFQRAKAVL